MRPELEKQYREVVFTGARHGEDLARHYASADVFVFPSRTDTFGLVLLEALACGIPVAAYPVMGPIDVIGDSGAGCLDEDLAQATRKALEIRRDICRTYAETFSWAACAQQFIDNLEATQPAGTIIDTGEDSQPFNVAENTERSLRRAEGPASR